VAQIGSQSSSFSKTVTAIQQLIHESGLRYHTHTTGTTIGKRFALPCINAAIRRELILYLSEGEWDKVMRVIGVAHTLVHHAGISRIQTDLRVLTRYAIRP